MSVAFDEFLSLYGSLTAASSRCDRLSKLVVFHVSRSEYSSHIGCRTPGLTKHVSLRVKLHQPFEECSVGCVAYGHEKPIDFEFSA